MVTDQLKSATLPAHQQLEKLLVYRIKAVSSVEDYLNLLRLFYGFCHPLEGVMMPLLSDAIIADLDERRKSTALLQDMERLRGGEVEAPLCDGMPVLSSSGAALGALYVMEGSTLGGSIIADMIRKRLPELPEDSLHFFTGYGPETEAKWTAFKLQLDAFATSEQDKKAVIDGANETFLAFHNWIKQHETTAVHE